METDDKKIAFITCVNDESTYKETLHYISRLQVPKGYSYECVAVRGASAMTAGYQHAMCGTNAKYKVYLHQDVFIIHPNFMQTLVETFMAHPKLGMLGMVGGRRFSGTGTWWIDTDAYGGVYQVQDGKPCLNLFSKERTTQDDFEKVVTVDGLLMATQYDVEWRTDLFKDWHFYDLSQCCEFIRQGYQVGVCSQHKGDAFEPWCLHLGSGNFGEDWERERKVFLKAYSHMWK